ncbi:NUDIX hydrolase [Dactylosporangium sp. CS-047395]|uniref:NUDIX hydrolase n=1 Tax=Dactylosporangium sp. CS-047395 TaxID=3239936 RepID=UPI003D89EDCE
MLADLISAYRPADPAESADVDRVRELLATGGDVWSRDTPLHVTASALIVHPPTARILLRWHARQEAWLQVGGHGDPGETDPVAVALREGEEETGLADLAQFGTGIVHVVVVPVKPKGNEPAHEHADVRFVLSTGTPDAARPEKPDAPLRWLTLPEALDLATEPNLRETIARVGHLLHG